MTDKVADVCWAYRELTDTGHMHDVPLDPSDLLALRTLLGYVTQPLHRCEICSHPIQWINADTGGWWAHLEHPRDSHDAVAGGPVLVEEYLC